MIKERFFMEHRSPMEGNIASSQEESPILVHRSPMEGNIASSQEESQILVNLPSRFPIFHEASHGNKMEDNAEYSDVLMKPNMNSIDEENTIAPSLETENFHPQNSVRCLDRTMNSNKVAKKNEAACYRGFEGSAKDLCIKQDMTTQNLTNVDRVGEFLEHEKSSRNLESPQARMEMGASIASQMTGLPNGDRDSEGISQAHTLCTGELLESNQMSLASWGKDIMREMDLMHMLKRPPGKQLQHQKADISQFGSASKGSDKLEFPCSSQLSDQIKCDDTHKYGSVPLQFSFMKPKYLQSLQSCISKEWVTIVQTPFSVNDDIVWVVDEQEDQYFKCRRTFSYLRALANGLLIVSSEWLLDSANNGERLFDAHIYEIAGSVGDRIQGAPSRARQMERDTDGRSRFFSKYAFRLLAFSTLDHEEVKCEGAVQATKLRALSSADFESNQNDEKYQPTSPAAGVSQLSLEQSVFIIDTCGGKILGQDEVVPADLIPLGLIVPSQFLKPISVVERDKIITIEKASLRAIVSLNWVTESVFNQTIFDFTEFPPRQSNSRR